MGWTVQNVGTGAAGCPWQDEVVLQQVGQPNSQYLVLGTFDQLQRAWRRQLVQPHRGGHRCRSTSAGSTTSRSSPTTTARCSRTGRPPTTPASPPPPITVTVTPRPDLQVAAIDIPASGERRRHVLGHVHRHQPGNAPTTNNWDDKVYLSLTPYVADDSILIQDLPNQAALEPGDEYQATTVPVVVPERFRGQVYVIVVADANHVVDQWPNGAHNLEYQPIFVNPLPLPDLVVSNVVAPTQVIAGSTFNVSYTVTNLGAGPTLVDTWTDSIWLTRDKTRPIPAQGDILLTQVAHTGGLGVKAGYDQTVTVTLPINLDPGPTTSPPGPTCTRWSFRTSWRSTSTRTTPTTSRTTTTRRARSTILAPLPDLVVTSVTAPTQAQGGDNDHGLLDGAEHRQRRRPADRLDRHRLPDQRPHQSARQERHHDDARLGRAQHACSTPMPATTPA